MEDNSGFNRAIMSGAQSASDTLQGVSMGSQRLMSDLGSALPEMPSSRLHPFIEARHGMYAQEMSFGGDVAAIFGRGTPKTTTAYEYQELAARDLGTRIGTGLTSGALYGTSAIASWNLGTAGVSAGWKAGKAVGTAKYLKAAGTTAKALGTAGRIGLGAAAGAAGLAGVALGLAPVLAAEAVVSKIAADMEDRSDITGYLEASSFRYATGGGKDIDKKFGAGFNSKARGKIASEIKKVDLGDSFYSMGDLKGVLESGTQLGMFDGANSADEFGRKFKTLTSTLKKVAKTLHTSLADGMKVIKDLKDQGYSSGAGMDAAIMTADVLGTATGRTASEMLSIGRQGTEMVRGTGIGLSTGSSMFQSTMSNIEMLASSGDISQEMIGQAGGKGALAQGLLRQDIGLMQSTLGRGMMAAATGADGRLNLGAIRGLASGDIGLDEMAKMGSSSMTDPASLIRKSINQSKNMREMAKEFGDTGIQAMALGSTLAVGRELAAATGVSVEEGMRYNMINRGMSESEIEAQMSTVKNVGKLKARKAAAFKTIARKAQSELVSEKLDITGRIGDAIDRQFNPISSWISSKKEAMSESISEFFSEKTTQVTEYLSDTELVSRSSLTKEDAQVAILEGKGGVKGGAYASSLFTDQDSANFRDSKAYNKLREKYEGKEISAKAIDSTDLNMYSKAITGRSFGNLTRDEKMYVEGEIKRTGRTELAAEVDNRQDRAAQAFRNSNLTSVKEANKVKKEAEVNLVNVREGALEKVGLGGVKDKITSTEDGRKLFDEYVELGQKVSTAGDLKGKSLKEQEEILQDRIKLKKLKGNILGQTGLKGENAKIFLASELSADEAKALGTASGELEVAQKGAKASALFQSTSDSFSRILTLDSALEGDDENNFKRGVADIGKFFASGGKTPLKMDYNKMAELSGKAGYGNLSRSLGEAARLKSPEKDMKKVRRILGVSSKISDEQIQGYIGEDGLDASELLRFKVGENLSDKTGSPTLMNKGTDGGEIGKRTAKVAESLASTEQRIAATVAILDEIASKIATEKGIRVP